VGLTKLVPVELHRQESKAEQEPSSSTMKDCNPMREFQAGRQAKGGFGWIHLSQQTTCRWYYTRWYTIYGKYFGIVTYTFLKRRDCTVSGYCIGISCHKVKFANLCMYSFICISATGSRLLTKVEVDSLKINLGAWILYSTGTFFGCSWQETCGGSYTVRLWCQQGRRAF